MQLDLFSTGIVCAHCRQDPGRNPNNPGLWNGFLDKETGEHVCHTCGKFKWKINGTTYMGIHYGKKRERMRQAGTLERWIYFPRISSND